ncbi:MAG TPA: DUF2461 domain-containing protein [Vicinamibacterales bacterium]|nr:DUF2461 domain-containing protein [Vicinamibacterales bacterium]
MSAARFTDRTVKFLRALRRNNRREWFNAHKDDYEAHVRQPMAAMVERLAVDFLAFAPELVANPKTSLYRIYRDTRFSADKKPYKTHAAAVFPTRTLNKHEGAGLYFHVGCDEVWIGGGMYAPSTPQLAAVREHIAGNVRRLRSIVESPGFKRRVGGLEGEKLARVPRGFPKDHEAADYLRYRQFIAGREFPPAFAASPAFYRTLLRVFQEVAPLSRFLNEPLLKG